MATTTKLRPHANGRPPRTRTAPAAARTGRAVVAPPKLAFTIDRDLYVVDYPAGTDPAGISNHQHAVTASRLLTLMAKRDDDSLFHLDTEGTFFLLVRDEADGWRAARTFTLTGLLHLTTTDRLDGTLT